MYNITQYSKLRGQTEYLSNELQNRKTLALNLLLKLIPCTHFLSSLDFQLHSLNKSAGI